MKSDRRLFIVSGIAAGAAPLLALNFPVFADEDATKPANDTKNEGRGSATAVGERKRAARSFSKARGFDPALCRGLPRAKRRELYLP